MNAQRDRDRDRDRERERTRRKPAIVCCETCPVGKASGPGRCPFSDRRWQPGELVQLEGAPADSVGFVMRGAVVLARATDAGGEIVHAVRSVGDFIGLEALVRPTYLDTARAITTTTVCRAPREVVGDWLGAEGTPARLALEQTLRTSSADIPRGARPDGRAVARVARWIMAEEHASNGNGQQIPRRIVAGLLGMAPETLSRALAELARKNAIHLTRRSIKIKEPDALEAAAGA